MFYDACKRAADIDVEAIAAKYGRSVMLTEIGAKARCNECGGLRGGASRGGRMITLSKMKAQ
jgi:hypothetical protein